MPINVTRSSMPELQEYVDEIRDLWDSHWLTNMGVKHRQFQQALREFLGVEQVELLTNGHMALELSLQALELPEGGEVITTPFTFASTTHAIVRAGLKPVFCDIDPVTYTLDPARLEALITDATCAIMPVHVYGNICDVEGIERIAQKHGLKVIYDAAHAFGERYKGRSPAVFGDVSCFSFHATKVFNSIEGGCACFRDERFGKRLYNLKNFGIDGPEDVVSVGANAKLNEFCAAMGLCNLRHLDEEIAKRAKVDARYRAWLGGVKGLKLNAVQPDVEPNYAYFPVIFEDDFGANRDEVFERLAENGIAARKYFYPLTSGFQAYSGRFDPADTPIALRISQRVLTLPMYADLPLEDVDRICDIILGCGK